MMKDEYVCAALGGVCLRYGSRQYLRSTGCGQRWSHDEYFEARLHEFDMGGATNGRWTVHLHARWRRSRVLGKGTAQPLVLVRRHPSRQQACLVPAWRLRPCLSFRLSLHLLLQDNCSMPEQRITRRRVRDPGYLPQNTQMAGHLSNEAMYERGRDVCFAAPQRSTMRLSTRACSAQRFALQPPSSMSEAPAKALAINGSRR